MNILATCTPYQVGNIPVRGEHCAWMESSAVIYANYHIPGLTSEAPTLEAPTLEAAFGTSRLPESAVNGPTQRQAVHDTLNAQGTSPDVDFVLLGCPHASADQVRLAADALDGRRLSPGTWSPTTSRWRSRERS